MHSAQALTPALSPSQGKSTTETRRNELFRETPLQRALRWVLGLAYACKPKRLAALPYLWLWCALDMARGGTRVPDPARVKIIPDTFGGVARAISPETILAAARKGFFPWCHVGPLKWWTREQRMVLKPGDFRISKTTKRLMKKSAYRVTFDTAFDDVIKACAGRRKNRLYGLTWITPKMMRLYAGLHDMGAAHSFEVWNGEGELVGGGYGISIGRCFFTESQFSLESNTSKMGFATLTYHLAKWGYVLNDGKDWTPTIEEAGFQLVPRAEFEGLMGEHGQGPSPAVAWNVEADLATVSLWDGKSTPGAIGQAA